MCSDVRARPGLGSALVGSGFTELEPGPLLRLRLGQAQAWALLVNNKYYIIINKIF